VLLELSGKEGEKRVENLAIKGTNGSKKRRNGGFSPPRAFQACACKSAVFETSQDQNKN
jgi:hypothetical protein